MSHIVSIKTQVKDAAAVRAGCQRLKLPEPSHRITRIYSRDVEGLTVELPNWKYPIVCDLTSGELQYDNFGGRWGQEAELHRFLQAYAVEKAKIEGRRQGHTVHEQALADGSIRVQISVAG